MQPTVFVISDAAWKLLNLELLVVTSVILSRYCTFRNQCQILKVPSMPQNLVEIWKDQIELQVLKYFFNLIVLHVIYRLNTQPKSMRKHSKIKDNKSF